MSAQFRLREELKQNGLEQNDVYLMTADEKQNVYLARKEETA